MPKGNSPSQGSRNQNKSPFDVIRNSVNEAYNITSNAFRSLGNMLSQTPEVQALNQGLQNIPVGGTPSPFQPAANTPQFYQVKRDDKGLDDIATRHNIPLDYLSQINQTRTLPPTGSYIQLVNRGMSPTVAGHLSGMASYAQSLRVPSPMGEGRGDASAQRLRVQANQLTAQLAQGILPPTIPSAVVGFMHDAQGKPLTIQDFIAEGYVMNNQGILVKGGTANPPGTQSDNNYATNPALHLVTFNPNAKNRKSSFQTTEKWLRNAIRRKQGKGKNRRPATPTQPVVTSTTTEGPQTILDIHLGSG